MNSEGIGKSFFLPYNAKGCQKKSHVRDDGDLNGAIDGGERWK